ncbi:MAG: D-tyrosyl-tRNA(Tyr) deacylase [Deltaproteobacteria bacterium]|nr:D-tyrosyl-tRNA(Tyr) deacylase [Deltaproteobacteria bacterium]
MKALIQRVSQAGVMVEGKTIAQIGPGLLVFLGVAQEDDRSSADYLAEKILGLRIFSDLNGKMNHSLIEIGGAILLVSQFTLLGDCRKGRRPSFTGAAEPKKAEDLYEYMAWRLGQSAPVSLGRFGANMAVNLVNDGPVTIILECPFTNVNV